MAKRDISTEYHRIMNERGWTGVIDAEQMVREICFVTDLNDVSRKELERAYVNQRVMVALNDDGFYSAGRRMYCNPDAIDEPRIKREAAVRETNKRIKISEIHEKLERIAKKNLRELLKGQLRLNFEEDEHGLVIEEMTDEEFLELLSSLAEEAT